MILAIPPHQLFLKNKPSINALSSTTDCSMYCSAG